MVQHLLLFVSIFIVGELLISYTAFRYIKRYFKSYSKELENESEQPKERLFFGLHLSTFKGILERLVLFYALVLGIHQILIVFGTLKIGSQLTNRGKVENDYFLVGNFCSIFCTLIYLFAYITLKNQFLI